MDVDNAYLTLLKICVQKFTARLHSAVILFNFECTLHVVGDLRKLLDWLGTTTALMN